MFSNRPEMFIANHSLCALDVRESCVFGGFEHDRHSRQFADPPGLLSRRRNHRAPCLIARNNLLREHDQPTPDRF